MTKEYDVLSGDKVFQLATDDFGEAYIVIQNGEVTFRSGDKVIPVLPDVEGEDCYFVERQDEYDKMDAEKLRNLLRERDQIERVKFLKEKIIECQNKCYNVGSYIVNGEYGAMESVANSLIAYATYIKEYTNLCS